MSSLAGYKHKTATDKSGMDQSIVMSKDGQLRVSVGVNSPPEHVRYVKEK